MVGKRVKELVLTQGRKLARENFRVILPDAANHGERKTQLSERFLH